MNILVIDIGGTNAKIWKTGETDKAKIPSNQKLTPAELITQVKERLREAKDRLSDADMIVANFYLSIRLYAGAEPRYRHVLDTDPEYTRKDSLYFHLAETLEKTARKTEALPYYERLVKEFEKSEYLEEAARRIERLKLELKLADSAAR